jgi:translation initiation factor IF-2
MSSNTVAQFAIELKMPANVLLEQLRAAGVELTSVEDHVTDGDKARLLESLRRSHGATEGKKITLTRRQTSEIRQADGSGRSRTIQVEVRKKRVFVKRDTPESGDIAQGVGTESDKPTQPVGFETIPVVQMVDATGMSTIATAPAEVTSSQSEPL